MKIKRIRLFMSLYEVHERVNKVKKKFNVKRKQKYIHVYKVVTHTANIL